MRSIPNKGAWATAGFDRRRQHEDAPTPPSTHPNHPLHRSLPHAAPLPAGNATAALAPAMPPPGRAGRPTLHRGGQRVAGSRATRSRAMRAGGRRRRRPATAGRRASAAAPLLRKLHSLNVPPTRTVHSDPPSSTRPSPHKPDPASCAHADALLAAGGRQRHAQPRAAARRLHRRKDLQAASTRAAGSVARVVIRVGPRPTPGRRLLPSLCHAKGPSQAAHATKATQQVNAAGKP